MEDPDGEARAYNASDQARNASQDFVDNRCCHGDLDGGSYADKKIWFVEPVADTAVGYEFVGALYEGANKMITGYDGADELLKAYAGQQQVFLMTELQFAIGNAVTHQTVSGQGRRSVIPAPVSGWNTRDPEAAMDPSFALKMENYFPERGRVVSRRGSNEYADLSITDDVETLFNWVSSASNKLFAVAGTKLYDITDPNSTTEEVTTGITNARWRGVNMNGQGILVNGTDAPLRIDSSGSWVPHGYAGTGLVIEDLTQCAVFKNRLFFLEKDSPNLWYGDLNAITGTLSKINLGLVNEMGGNCLAVGSLTLDTGIGVDDLLAIFMSRGHVLIYAGTDPSSANAWQISGIYHLGKVIGDRPLVKLGGDLIAITSDGYIPLLQFIGAGREQRQLAISDNIAPTVTDAVRIQGGFRRLAADPAQRGQLAAVQRPCGE